MAYTKKPTGQRPTTKPPVKTSPKPGHEAPAPAPAKAQPYRGKDVGPTKGPESQSHPDGSFSGKGRRPSGK